MPAHPASTEKLERMLGYLEADPANQPLLAEAAEAALGAGEGRQALALLDRLAEQRTLNDPDLNLVGMAALQSRDYDRAATLFGGLVARNQGDPSLHFNLAWSLFHRGAVQDAIETLDDDATSALPQAAMLKVQLLHEAGRMADAETLARAAIEQHPGHAGLLAATSVLAIDLDDLELAGACASQAGDHPDALTTLGTLALGADDVAAARSLFARALELNPQSPRARIGRGLSALADGDPALAASDIDAGAAIFGDHLGSLIAAGWAFFLAGNSTEARQRFERVVEIDPTFAEGHGSLAVTDILNGELDGAQRKVEVALRLDRHCFSAVLAQLMLRTGHGDADGAKRILERALEAPIDERGRTLGQALARTSLTGRPN